MTYHARSRTSSPAAQQLRFCNLALSVLDQASFHSVPLPLHIESIIPLAEPSAVDGDSKRHLSPSLSDKLPQSKRYALMQRLPSGSWWSSLSSDLPDPKDLQTANAELVAIFPSPSSLAYTDDSSKSTITLTDTQTPTMLGAYVPKRPPGHRSLPGPRRVSCGSFLDYGPYASFAPVFDQEGVEVGREALGEVLYGWEHQKKAWAAEKSRATQKGTLHPTDGDEGLEEQTNVIDPSLQECHNDDDETLEGLLSKEQVASLKSALKSLELEDAVQELLERNARALKRLEELQRQRLMRQGGFHPVEEGSEEWDTGKDTLDKIYCLTYTCLQLRTFSSHLPYWHRCDPDNQGAKVYPLSLPPLHSANYIARSLLRLHRAGMVLCLQVVQRLSVTTQHFTSSPRPLRCLLSHQPYPLLPLQFPLLRLLLQHQQLHRTTLSTRTIMRQATVAAINTSPDRQLRTTRVHTHKGRHKPLHNTMLTSSTQHRGNSNIPTLPGTNISLRHRPLRQIRARGRRNPNREHPRLQQRRSQRATQASSAMRHSPGSAQLPTLSL